MASRYESTFGACPDSSEMGFKKMVTKFFVLQIVGIIKDGIVKFWTTMRSINDSWQTEEEALLCDIRCARGQELVWSDIWKVASEFHTD
ncbi:hypothetical protein OIU84_019966 [Salix udensis]|uniref:Uncharacterized protein n=1 Tax=Salix udensis TaxID=889485 RepID=A0AAD6L085_9ROSI|nr:hypothetical protein OIU84_019966 [Salix udensis]